MASPPIPDALEYLWDKLHELEPSTVLGGIYASKPGYHNTRSGNSPSNYSVVDPPDREGPANLAAALDWTFPDAQQADYDKIIKYSKRLLDSGKDVNDSRLDWMREFYGQADKDTAVEGWDYRYAQPASSDPSHLWHIHFSFSRNALTTANMDKLLDVLGYEEMDATETAKAVLETDGIIDNKYFPWRSDSPNHNPAPSKPNTHITLKTAVTEAANRADMAYEMALEVKEQTITIDADMQFVQAKLDQILALLQSGIPVPGEVVLSDASVAEVAEAVADENAARQQD